MLYYFELTHDLILRCSVQKRKYCKAGLLNGHIKHTVANMFLKLSMYGLVVMIPSNDISRDIDMFPMLSEHGNKLCGP